MTTQDSSDGPLAQGSGASPTDPGPMLRSTHRLDTGKADTVSRMIAKPHALALVTAVLAGAASAQSPSVVLRVGDAIPGAGKVTDIALVETSSGGSWTALVHSDDPLAHTVLYAWNSAYLKVGDSPASLGGATITSLQSPTWDLFGTPTFIAGLSGGAASQAVLYDGYVQFLTGQSATTHTGQLPAGSTWRRFDELHFAWANPYFLLRGAIDDPAGGMLDRSLAATVSHYYPGYIADLQVVALEGELAPGLSRSIERVRDGPSRARLSRSGAQVLWSCDLDGSGSDDGCVYSSQMLWPPQATLLAREGSPSPVAGRSWGPLEDIALDLNSSGSWTLRAQLDASDPGNDDVLVQDGLVLAREGEVHPAFAPYTLQSLGQGPGALDDNGRALWYARWDDPSTPGLDEALIQGGIPIVRTGSTSVAGSALVQIESGPRSYAVDPDNGRYVVFVGSLADGTRGMFLLDQGGMQAYCTAKTNSLGFVAQIGWSGQPPSASAGSGFELTAFWLLAHSPAAFFYGTDGPLAQPFHGGTLCVKPPLHRGPRLDSGGTSHASGTARFDFNAWIASGVDPSLVPGQQVHVQLWYRDRGFSAPEDIGLTAGLTFHIGP